MRRNLWTTLLCAALLASPVMNSQSQAAGENNLLPASSAGDLALVKALLAAGADVNAKDDNGFTALMAAANPGHLGVVRALLAAGADVNAKTDKGFTALIVAAAKGRLDVVRALLAAGADVNAKAENGITALIMAASDGHKEVVQALFDARRRAAAQSRESSLPDGSIPVQAQKHTTAPAQRATSSAPGVAEHHAVTLPLTGVLREALQNVDLVHLGDTDHSRKGSFLLWLGQEDTMQALAASGVKAIFFEEYQDLQPSADALWEGRITPEMFVTIMQRDSGGLWGNRNADLRERAAIIRQARSAGIRVYFADPGLENIGQLELQHLQTLLAATPFGSLKNFWALGGEKSPLMRTLPLETQSKLGEAQDALLKKRAEQDADVAALIHGKLGPGEKGILFYGASHGSGKNDLNEDLAALGTRSVKIDVFPDRTAYFDGVARSMSREDPPAGYYILDRRFFYPTERYTRIVPHFLADPHTTSLHRRRSPKR